MFSAIMIQYGTRKCVCCIIVGECAVWVTHLVAHVMPHTRLLSAAELQQLPPGSVHSLLRTLFLPRHKQPAIMISHPAQALDFKIKTALVGCGIDTNGIETRTQSESCQ